MSRRPVKDERREQILSGLFQTMAQGGLIRQGRGASISEIAQAAGIARGALHYFFESKEEILVALMRRLGEQYAAGLVSHVDNQIARVERTGAPRSDVVRGVVRYHFGGAEDVMSRTMTVWIDFWGQAPSHQGIHAEVFDVQERARLVCERAIAYARPELLAADAATRRALGATVLSTIEGGLLQWRIASQSALPLDRGALCGLIGDAAVALIDASAAPFLVVRQQLREAS